MLISCINFLWIVTIQIQTRNVRDQIGKENTTISLMDCKIINLYIYQKRKEKKDYNVWSRLQKVIWCLSILFLHVKSKSWSPKKYEVKGLNKYNSNQFMASQNLLYNFFKWISNEIFFQRFSVFETHFQESSILQEIKISMDTFVQNLE